tara:strand:- start:380 stop:850 length:471 start_codon:yes stop_codon:yes gene_type:complete
MNRCPATTFFSRLETLVRIGKMTHVNSNILVSTSPYSHQPLTARANAVVACVRGYEAHRYNVLILSALASLARLRALRLCPGKRLPLLAHTQKTVASTVFCILGLTILRVAPYPDKGVPVSGLTNDSKNLAVIATNSIPLSLFKKRFDGTNLIELL